MKRIATLVRRDLADYSGALTLTPLITAAVILVLAVIGVLAGTSSLGSDNSADNHRSGATITDEDNGEIHLRRDESGKLVVSENGGPARPVEDRIDSGERATIAAVVPLATLGLAGLPIVICAFTVLFVLAGALYDERKDRSVLFWKSMPVGDVQTAAAKMVSIVGAGFAMSLAVVIALHALLVTIGMLQTQNAGLGGLPWGAIYLNVVSLWPVMALLVLTYVGWALPVYAWFLAVGAAAPKAPFVLAAVPLGLIPAVAGLLNLPGGFSFWGEPLVRLSGARVFGDGEEFKALDGDMAAQLPIAESLAALSKTFLEPGFWLGLVVAGLLIWAAGEIRGRRTI